MYSIQKFDFKENKQIWNLFIKNNSDGHFFFETDYLFYHKKYFEDFSLLIYKKTELVCVLPACLESMENKKILHSHKGLTFGGFIFKDKLSFLEKRKVVFACLDFLKNTNFNSLIIKPLPSYFLIETNESIHRLLNDNLIENKILRVEANSVIDLPKNELDYKNNYQNYSKRKKRNLQKAFNSNLKLEKTNLSTLFWQIIEENLKTRHHLLPVHSAAEIQLLHTKFSQNIAFFVVKNDTENNTEIIACSVVFIYQNVIHVQYMAATKEGKVVNALDFMIDKFIKNHSIYFDKNKLNYLSLGVSELRNNTQKDSINEGLFKWKEEFGAKTFSHFVYQINM